MKAKNNVTIKIPWRNEEADLKNIMYLIPDLQLENKDIFKYNYHDFVLKYFNENQNVIF